VSRVGEKVATASFSPDGARLFTIDSDGQASLFAGDDGDKVAGLGPVTIGLYPLGEFHTARFSPDSARIATSRDGVLRNSTPDGKRQRDLFADLSLGLKFAPIVAPTVFRMPRLKPRL
jgi:WD40 repeat protein